MYKFDVRRSRVQPIVEEAGVREVRLHDTRYPAATMLLLLRVDKPAVMDIMGRSRMSMTSGRCT